jgi:hypothetical protein
MILITTHEPLGRLHQADSGASASEAHRAL